MRNKSVYVFVLLLLVLTQTSHSSYAQKKKPNVLFIAVDDLKPFLEPYGDKIVKSPAISKIASRGMVFERNYCQQAVCAPTRASLLTGLRPDRTGVWDLKTNFRLVDSTIVSLPEYLRSQGYETAGYGKIYHEAPETTFAGHDPKSWSVPYVKLTAPVYVLSDKKPSVEYADVHDTTYLDGKLAAGAIHALGNLAKGDKPFFLAVGFKKPHLPFVAPKKYWDLYRRDQFTVDPFQEKARNSPDVAYHISGELKSYSDIPDFDSYSDVPEKKLSIEKQKELLHGYYASISYTDAQVQKLLDEIDRLGLHDNTIIVLWGDHGWHLGDHGLWNKHSNFENATRSTLLFSVPWIKGGIKTSSLTEFVDVYPTIVDLLDLPIPADSEGGTHNPLIVFWPAGIKERGVRTQYSHVTDITPTTLELLGVRAPSHINGYQQEPFEGTSFAYSVANAKAPGRKTVQYYEINGSRSIYKEGWKAAAYHERGKPFSSDQWELFNLNDDYNERFDLSAKYPEKLKELQEQFDAEAAKYNVYPLKDGTEPTPRTPTAFDGKSQFVFYPGISQITEVPAFINRSFAIVAHAEIPASGAEGVLLSLGGRPGGISFFVQNKKLQVVYNFGSDKNVITSTRTLPAGKVELRYEFESDGDPVKGTGTGTLFINGVKAGEGRVAKPARGSAYEGLSIGKDIVTPVSDTYKVPYEFTGKIKSVSIELKEKFNVASK